MPKPFTQSLTLRWIPELRFFERRYEILKTLQDRGDLWAFQAHERVVQARLFDLAHQLSIGQNSASLHLLTPDAELKRAWGTLELAVQTLEPRQPSGMAVTFQFVEPLETDFDAAVRQAHATTVKIPGTESIRPDDWAVLLDLKLSEPEGGIGQTEFGIVRAREVATRLRREVGRVSMAQTPSIEHDEWETNEFAPVSLFADVTFSAPAVPGTDALDALKAFWDALRVEAGTFVTGLKKQLVADEYRREAESA